MQEAHDKQPHMKKERKKSINIFKREKKKMILIMVINKKIKVLFKGPLFENCSHIVTTYLFFIDKLANLFYIYLFVPPP